MPLLSCYVLRRDPGVKVRARSASHRCFARLLVNFFIKRREQAKVDVHRLIIVGKRVAGYMAEQCSKGCGLGRRRHFATGKVCSSHNPSHEADCAAFDIAFAARDLACKPDVRR